MARLGVDYEKVKQTAIKLLSQGSAPSVQKVREVLGTGSHTTIAAHLMKWREEHAKSKVHYLPAHMPKELISAFEVLWQTAMEQASHQFASKKEELEKDRTQIIGSQQEAEKNSKELKQNYDVLLLKLEQHTATHQQLKTELAVIEERLQKQSETFTQEKNHYETRIKRSYQEKDEVIQENQKLQIELAALREKIITQAEAHQSQMEKQRGSQEQSENRWLNLIDQAKVETKEVQKQFENYRKNSEQALIQVKDKLANSHQSQLEQAAEIKANLKQLDQFKKDKSTLVAENRKLQNIISTLKKQTNNKKVATRKSKKLVPTTV